MRIPRRSRLLTTLAVVPAIALGVAACSDDGTSGEGDAQPAEVDACASLSTDTLEQLNLSAEDAVELTDPDEPGCEWQGVNAADGADADILLWVLGPDSHQDTVDAVDIDGVEVGIWQMSDDSGRYVVPCKDVNLVLNYLQNHGPLAPADALDLAAADVIAAYGCA